MAKRILLATLGSFGDVHPYIALGLGLRARGHQVTFASTNHYRQKVEGEGMEFAPLRPDMPVEGLSPALMRRMMHPERGPEAVIREFVVPHLRQQYEDLHPLAEGADLLVSHMLTFVVPLLAEQLGRPWVATYLQPLALFSAYDPPLLPVRGVTTLLRLHPALARVFYGLIQGWMRRWTRPVDELRQELGLPYRGAVMFEGSQSPYLNLALFSPLFAPPQPDWPKNTVATGFPFYDRYAPGLGMPDELRSFLEAGPPPLVFTLGSSAVLVGGDFYTESIGAARLLERRAVLLIGRDEWNRIPRPLPEGMIACGYAPHSELFPHAAAIIHQGGVGTTAQGLRSGRPALVVPFSHDQPDNANRVVRLGCGRTIPRHRYAASSAARELRLLLESSGYESAARSIGEKLRREDGVSTACDALETLLEGWRVTR